MRNPSVTFRIASPWTAPGMPEFPPNPLTNLSRRSGVPSDPFAAIHPAGQLPRLKYPTMPADTPVNPIQVPLWQESRYCFSFAIMMGIDNVFPVRDNVIMKYLISKTDTFERWLDSLERLFNTLQNPPNTTKKSFISKNLQKFDYSCTVLYNYA